MTADLTLSVEGEDFSHGPVVENMPSNAGDVGSIPGFGNWDPTCCGAAKPYTVELRTCMPQHRTAQPKAHQHVHFKRELETHTHTRRTPCEDESRVEAMLLQAGNTKGPQGASRSEAKHEQISCQHSEGAPSSNSVLDFWPPRDCETHTSVVHPVCDTLLRKLEQTMTEVDDKYRP